MRNKPIGKSKPKRKGELKGVSRRQFARLAECSEATVRNHISSGWLDLLADGSLDPADAEAFALHVDLNRGLRWYPRS